tara:strand:+ start:1560 stop:2834 length:1275 start_codon:yes stop_codon:yes gene_type:complete
MATELKMPQMGYDMEEGTVVRWLKEEGSQVSKNEPVAEIETDKAVVEFESEVDGTLLKILANEGSIVPVGQTIAVVGNETEAIPQISLDTDSDDTDSVEEVPDNSHDAADMDVSIEIQEKIPNTNQRVLATPVARRIADETGIELRNVQGSGPGGRITKKDVENFDPEKTAIASEPLPVDPNSSDDDEKITSPTVVSASIEPLSRMRQQIARVTVKSKTEKPHFYVSAEINMSNAMSLRKQINDQKKDEGVRITVNDLIVKACIDGIKQHNKFNAYYTDDGIQYNDDINIAIAISDDEGLIVPAILDCGGKSLKEVSSMVKDLAQRSANGTLTPNEYTGGTFAISNMGMFDVSSFVAIIHPPQSAVLAVGTVSEKPIVENGEITVAQMMTATLSADHRIVDGAEGAQFLITIKDLLENPTGLIL